VVNKPLPFPLFHGSSLAIRSMQCYHFSGCGCEGGRARARAQTHICKLENLCSTHPSDYYCDNGHHNGSYPRSCKRENIYRSSLYSDNQSFEQWGVFYGYYAAASSLFLQPLEIPPRALKILLSARLIPLSPR